MEKLIFTGRTFFAVACIGLGIEHFIFQDFITGRAPPWPEILFPGRLVWAYLSGTAIVVMGLAILSGKKARIAAIFAGIVIFLWAFLRHIPLVVVDSFLAPSWTEAGKALTFFGGAFAIAGSLPEEENKRNASFSKFINLDKEFIQVGRICLGLFLMITGIQHFMFTEFVGSLIPGWFPGDAVLWTYFAGVALIAGGAGILFPHKVPVAPAAALLSGVMVFSWFWIIHIPRTFVSVSDGIAVFEALAVSGIAFVLAGFLFQQKTDK